MVAVLCHNVWVARFVAVVAGIVNTLWVRETSNSAWRELGSGSFPRGCPLSGGHLTLEVELTRPSGAARPQHRKQGTPGFHQQKWLLHTLTVQGDG